jgi:hypothetical protein
MYCLGQGTVSTWSGADTTTSTITGNGTGSAVSVGETYRIDLRAFDTSGDRVNIGGDDFIVEIHNHCTFDNGKRCDPTGSSNILDENIVGRMIDNSDGSYFFDYSIPPGNGLLTIFITLAQPGVHMAYYPNSDTSVAATPIDTNIYLNINFYWGLDDPANGGAEDNFI